MGTQFEQFKPPMSTEASLKFFGLGSIRDGTLLFTHSGLRDFEATGKSECQSLLTRVQENNVAANERQKVTTQSGSWFFLVDEREFGYFLLTRPGYAERLAFEMIRDAKFQVDVINDPTSPSLKRQLKSSIETLFGKFNRPEKLDSLSQAQANVEGVQLVMEDNIRKLMVNTESIDGLSQKTQKMNDMSRNFQKQSADLARIMYWRNMKLKIIIGVLVVGILLYIIIPIVKKD
eukprot:TRINITY_DN5301_c0_g1_i3.p1 TRINITY_DN5301_c0_g1~~TRINITY_DN5301_c0_g1_i3.p1  ORF type:complete len:266 (+),score=70.23 TRINITY_DN5301_c0_g1_i3:101-799(+)